MSDRFQKRIRADAKKLASKRLKEAAAMNIPPVLVSAPDGKFTDNNKLIRSSIDGSVIGIAAASSSVDVGQGPAAAAAKPPEEEGDCPTIDEYKEVKKKAAAAKKEAAAMRKKLVDAGIYKSSRKRSLDTPVDFPLEVEYCLSEAEEAEINKILEEQKIDGSDDAVDEGDDAVDEEDNVQIEGMSEDSDDGIDDSPKRSPEELAILKDVRDARIVPMSVRKEMEEDMAKNLQGIIPDVKAGQGRMSLEWRAIAYILCKCHVFFQDYYKETRTGQRIHPKQLPYDVVAGLVRKSNGEHPTESSLRRTVLSMRAHVAEKGTFSRPTQGVGRPPLVSKEQVELIAEILMKMKKEFDGYAFFFHRDEFSI